MKTWKNRHSIKVEELVGELYSLPTISQYSCIFLRLVLDRTNANKMIYGRADFISKSDSKPNEDVQEYDAILIIQKILNIDQFKKLLSDMITQGKSNLDSIEIKNEFEENCNLEICHSNSSHASIKSDFPFYYYSIRLKNSKNYDSYVPVSGKDIPPYPNVSTAVIDSLDLYSMSKKAEWINDNEFIISAPDCRAGIKKLKIEKNKISIQIISKLLKDEEMYAQFYTEKKSKGNVEIKNGIAETKISNADKIMAIVKEKANEEMLDYFDYTVRWGRTEESVEKVIPEEIVKNWIDGGENETIEFKEVLKHADDVAKSVVAFANTNGGIILLGVKDDCSIVGYKESLDGTRERLERMLSEKCDPPIPFDLQQVNVGEMITIIKISKGDKKIYSVTNGGTYVRRNSSDRFIKPSELEEIFSHQNQDSISSAF